jgi:hypothetical protein
MFAILGIVDSRSPGDLAGIVIGDSILASDEDWLRVALRDHPRTHTLAILSAAVALHPGVLIRE